MSFHRGEWELTGQVLTAFDIEFPEQPGEALLHGTGGDEQLGCDLLVGIALAGEGRVASRSSLAVREAGPEALAFGFFLAGRAAGDTAGRSAGSEEAGATRATSPQRASAPEARAIGQALCAACRALL